MSHKAHLAPSSLLPSVDVALDAFLWGSEQNIPRQKWQSASLVGDWRLGVQEQARNSTRQRQL